MLGSFTHHMAQQARSMTEGKLFKPDGLPATIVRNPFLGLSTLIMRGFVAHLVEYFRTGRTVIPGKVMAMGVLDNSVPYATLHPAKLAAAIEMLTGYFEPAYEELGARLGHVFDLVMEDKDTKIRLTFIKPDGEEIVMEVPEPEVSLGTAFVNIQLHGLYPLVFGMMRAQQTKGDFWLASTFPFNAPKQENFITQRCIILTVLVEAARVITGCPSYRSSQGSLAVSVMINNMVTTGSWEHFGASFSDEGVTISSNVTPIYLNTLQITPTSMSLNLSNEAVFQYPHQRTGQHQLFCDIVKRVGTEGPDTTSGLCLVEDDARNWLRKAAAGDLEHVELFDVEVDLLTTTDIDYRCVVVMQKGTLSIFSVGNGRVLFRSEYERYASV